MLELAQKLAAKPKDRTIRSMRVIFALILILVILFGWDVTMMEFWLPEYLKYILFVFPAIGLVRGIFDPGVFRRKVWKWVLVGVAAMMILINLVVIEDISTPQVSIQEAVSGELNINSIIQTSEGDRAFTLSTDNWFGFFGWILLFNALFLNNKNITTKNERYGEKVTKIRV